MLSTYAELQSELNQTKAELNQTKAELRQTKAELFASNELLKKALEEISKLREEVMELKKQINRNSKNSSKPPSTDQKGNTNPDKPNKRRMSRQGKARTPFSSERIDHHVECSQKNCPHCGSSAIQLNNQPAEVLQQAELPEAKAIVTEYHILKSGYLKP